MNKGNVIRASIVLVIFLVILGAAYGCSLIKSGGAEALVSDGDSVYLTVDGQTVTKAELWEAMKKVDGLDYLVDYLDSTILADYIAEVTQEEIDEAVLYLTYSTTSEDVIAEIQARPETNQEYLDSFNQTLVVLGYDPTNADDLRAYVELDIAKTNMAKDIILDSVDGDDYYISDATYKTSYDATTLGDVSALEVRFSNAVELKEVFNKFNLVLNFQTGIGEYVGTVPIADVANDEFTTENTVKLTDEQVFEKFVMLYNYMNPWQEAIPVDVAMSELSTLYPDVALYNYDEMTKDRSTTDPNVALANYIFNSLDDTGVDAVKFSYSAQAFSSSLSLVYKISSESVTAFEDLTAAELAEFKDEYLDAAITEDAIISMMETKRAASDIEIFDYYLKMEYEFSYGVSYDNKGSETVVATIGNTEITSEDLYSYMEERLGAFYGIQLTKTKVLLASDTYTELYGDDYDYMSNNSDEMTAHRAELRAMKAYFSSDSYASYGFSSSVYTWEEFLFLAFNSTSESEVLENLYIIGNLQPAFVYPTINYDSFSDYVQAQYDDYFSLNVTHLLMYVDFDKDFSPDSFDDFRDTFTPAELEEYSTLKVAFQNLVYSRIDEGMTYEEIVTEFKTGLIDDPQNAWAEFKAYGFAIMQEDLSESASLTAASTTNYDDAFVTSLKRVYDVYSRPENSDAAEYLDTQLTVTDFGIHLLLATPGTDFEQPTATYELTAENTADYTAGYDNAGDVPTEAQILNYLAIKFAETTETATDVILPGSVYTALEAYVSDIYDAYFTQTGASIATANYMLANNVTFGPASTQDASNVEDIRDVLYIVNFPDGFLAPTE